MIELYRDNKTYNRNEKGFNMANEGCRVVFPLSSETGSTPATFPCTKTEPGALRRAAESDREQPQ